MREGEGEVEVKGKGVSLVLIGQSIERCQIREGGVEVKVQEKFILTPMCSR